MTPHAQAGVATLRRRLSGLASPRRRLPPRHPPRHHRRRLASCCSFDLPPEPIRQIVESEPTPSLAIAPNRDCALVLHRPSLPPLSHLARPELRLAGLRVDAETRGRSRMTSYRSAAVAPLSLHGDAAGLGAEVPVTGAPEGMGLNFVSWSAKGTRVAFTAVEDNGSASQRRPLALYVADVPAAGALAGAEAISARLLLPDLNTVLDHFAFVGEDTILALTIPESHRGPPPQAPPVPPGPKVQSNASGEAKPARTYQDLLSSAHDADALEYLATSQLVRVDVATGASEALAPPSMITSFAPSPDGRYVLVARMERPFSYAVPCGRFPRAREVRRVADGEVVYAFPRLELAESVPLAHDACRTGVRDLGWRADAPAELCWAECRDGGDPEMEMPDGGPRDEVFLLDVRAAEEAARAGGGGEPTEPRLLAATASRYRGVVWGGEGSDLALLYESSWRTKRSVCWALTPSNSSKRVLIDRDSEDRYGSPGAPMLRRQPSGRYTVALVDGTHLLMSGQGASEEGDRPFLDLLELATGETERLWRSEAPYYEDCLSILSDAGGAAITRDGLRLLFSREAKEEQRQYDARMLADLGRRAVLTDFPHPYPALREMQKEIIRYSRADGVMLTATLYLPPGHDVARDGPLPTLLWAYPREFKSASAAGQMSGSPHAFTGIGSLSPLLFLTQGYAVLNGPSMPIVAEEGADPKTANDRYVEQLVSSATAAVEELERRGVSRRGSVAVGGHSYGAHMAMSLLAHADDEWFACGICRSGAYNRSLTPFGFQGETRTFWEAPDVYRDLSPFAFADRVHKPVLLLHGADDSNMGTYPMQSERMYAALKGHGNAEARLVLLPHEGHGYRARESVLHTLAEQAAWLDTHVPRPEAAVTTAIEEAAAEPAASGVTAEKAA